MTVTVLKYLLAAAGAGYLLSAVMFRLKKDKAAYFSAAVGWLLNTVVIAINWIHNGYVPFVSMYQVLTFLGACFLLVGAYMRFVRKDRLTAPYFVLCSAIVMAGTVIMDATLVWHFVPALQSIWFVPHVFSYMLSYSLCAVASLLSVVWIFSRSNREALDRSIYPLVSVAFPFMTAGIFLGAIWANEVWTEFWSWDAKENWALVTWLIYALYLHCRRHAKLKKYQYIFTILGVIALFMAFQGVSLFGIESSHSYS